jgi:thiol:disulfide interchange protein
MPSVLSFVKVYSHMSRFRLKTLFLFVLLAAFGSLALNRYLVTRPPTQGIYSSTALKKFLSDGRQVLVIVDADWAINPSSRPRYMSPEVSRRIRELNIATLAANWTKPNQTADTLMQSLNENAVPMLALFSPDDPANPTVLPHQASDADILNAIDGKARADKTKP